MQNKSDSSRGSGKKTKRIINQAAVGEAIIYVSSGGAATGEAHSIEEQRLRSIYADRIMQSSEVAQYDSVTGELKPHIDTMY
jgi:hypothetical protein